MTKAELSQVLYRLDVPSGIYRLDGTHYELAHVLAHRNGKWVVFLSERGTESAPVEFSDEDTACVYLFGRICHDLVERGRLRVAASRADS
jgi:hypothetical protein